MLCYQENFGSHAAIEALLSRQKPPGSRDRYNPLTIGIQVTTFVLQEVINLMHKQQLKVQQKSTGQTMVAGKDANP